MSVRLLMVFVFSSLVLLVFSPAALAQEAQRKPVYRYAQHHNFDIFYEDFKTALRSQDKDAVFKMTQMPFMCHAMECSALNREQKNDDYDASKDLSMRNKPEFLQKYDRVFTVRMTDFERGQFMNLSKVDPDDENARKFYSPTEQVLQSFYEDSDYNDSDVFSFERNTQGKYQLFNIPYRP